MQLGKPALGHFFTSDMGDSGTFVLIHSLVFRCQVPFRHTGTDNYNLVNAIHAIMEMLTSDSSEAF